MALENLITTALLRISLHDARQRMFASRQEVEEQRAARLRAEQAAWFSLVTMIMAVGFLTAVVLASSDFQVDNVLLATTR